MSRASRSPTAEVGPTLPDDSEFDFLSCCPSDRQAWNNRTKLAKEDLYIGLRACRNEIYGLVTNNVFLIDLIILFGICAKTGSSFHGFPNSPIRREPCSYTMNVITSIKDTFYSGTRPCTVK